MYFKKSPRLKQSPACSFIKPSVTKNQRTYLISLIKLAKTIDINEEIKKIQHPNSESIDTNQLKSKNTKFA